MPPFGAAIFILMLMTIVLFCLAVLAVLAYKLVTQRRLPIIGWIVGALVLTPLATLVIQSIIVGDIEYNPYETSIEHIAGTYKKGDQMISLGDDGLYSSKNIHGLSKGNWSNNDWNLRFSNSKLWRARLITRNGVYCILPYYSGVDSPDGLLLTKQ